MSQVEERLAALGLTVPEVAAPVAAYVPAVRSGSHVYLSGQLPFKDGALPLTGKVGGAVTAEQAKELAAVSALNAIAALKSVVGDLDKVVRIVKVGAFIACTPDFTGHPGVVHGASELFAAAFGEAGVHARSAVGVSALPLGAPVEVEVIVEIG